MSIEERIVKLERANRCWRWAAMGLMVVLSAVVCCAPSGNKTGTPSAEAVAAEKARSEEVQELISVRRINLVDKNNSPRGSIFADGDGAALIFTTPDGENMVRIDGRKQESLPGIFISTLEDGTAIGSGTVTISKTTADSVRQLKKDLQKDGPVDPRRLNVLVHVLRRTIRGEGDDIVSLRRGETGGGSILVRNPFGKDAVSIQSNKMNIGAVYVHKVDGSVGDALTVGP